MTRCRYCAEIDLSEGGPPICVQCAEEARTNRSLWSKLTYDVRRSTRLSKSARKEFDAVMSDIPSGLPLSDGTRRIHNAALRMMSAHNEMMKAYRRLDDFTERGIVPEDLKRKG